MRDAVLMKKFLMTIICFVLSASLFASLSAAAGVAAVFSSDIAPYRQAFDGFTGVMREKKSSVRIVEYMLGKEEADSIVQQIGQEKPVLVFTVGPDAAKFAREKVRNLPVVFSMVVQAGPLAGRNITGVGLEIPVKAKLEKIKRMFPGLLRIGVFYSPGSALVYREIEQACRSLGRQAMGKEIDSGKELPNAFKEMVPNIDVVFMVPDTKIFFSKSIEYLLVESMKSKVPVVGLSASYTQAGALVSFDADYRDLGRQTGELAVRVMNGERPADIEPAAPRRIKTSVNLVVAERLGIRIGPEVIKEASDVFR
jgi:putative ABC transport system substrate-binding protein